MSNSGGVPKFRGGSRRSQPTPFSLQEIPFLCFFAFLFHLVFAAIDLEKGNGAFAIDFIARGVPEVTFGLRG